MGHMHIPYDIVAPKSSNPGYVFMECVWVLYIGLCICLGFIYRYVYMIQSQVYSKLGNVYRSVYRSVYMFDDVEALEMFNDGPIGSDNKLERLEIILILNLQ